MNIQEQNKLEVADTEAVMADNEDLYPPPPQDISIILQRQICRLVHNLIQLNTNVHGSRRN